MQALTITSMIELISAVNVSLSMVIERALNMYLQCLGYEGNWHGY
jgi:hypothetical protein